LNLKNPELRKRDKKLNLPETAELRKSEITVPQLFLVRNSATVFVVRNIEELRTKIADAHL
jgi:glutaredoxin